MADTVLLLHGLLMRRPALLPMAWRLRGQGFRTALFTYSTLRVAPEAAMQRVAERMRSLGEGPVHLLAHSLGGLIAIEALKRHHDLPPGRVVCLGSPLAGSAAARGLLERRMGFAAGASGALLRCGVGELPPGREVGMIAGTRPIGLGRFFGRFEGQNDGTVAAAETRVPGLADHILIASSHSALIVSPLAATLAGRFLRTGRFALPSGS